MAAGDADGVPVVGGDAESGVIQALLHGLLVGVIDLRIYNFAAAELADFLRVEESELGLADLIPFPLGVDLIHFVTVDKISDIMISLLGSL